MLPEYEFLGLENVGEMSVEKYLSLAKDIKVKDAIKTCINKQFEPFVPDALKKYL
jgi:hypothetical protein